MPGRRSIRLEQYTSLRHPRSVSGPGAGFMKKRTSKSASATPKTSSPSGTSAQTDATANKPPQEPEDPGQFAYLVEELNKLTPADLRQSLVEAGIIDEEGKLTEKYRQQTKKGKRKHAS